jgi:hypothetical protein
MVGGGVRFRKFALSIDAITALSLPPPSRGGSCYARCRSYSGILRSELPVLSSKRTSVKGDQDRSSVPDADVQPPHGLRCEEAGNLRGLD